MFRKPKVIDIPQESGCPEKKTRMVPDVTEGSTVRVIDNVQEAKALNSRVGWKTEMQAALGKVGQAVKIDKDGDVLVSFGRRIFLFAPACCIPAPGEKLDMLSETDTQQMQSGGAVGVPDTTPQPAVTENKSPSATDRTPEAARKEESDALYRVLKEQMALEDRQSSFTSGSGDIHRLLVAVKHGDHFTVRKMCKANRSLLEREHQNLTPLVLACARGIKNLEVVTTLLELGADVNHGLPPFRNPLYAAMEGKSDQIVEMLLKAGADPFSLDRKRHTYIHIATAFELTGSIRALAAHGLDVNKKDVFGDTAVHYAVEHGHLVSLAALLQLDGVDLTMRNRERYSPLHLACLKGSARAVELILERDKSLVNQWYHSRNTPLHVAASNDHDECIRLLVLIGGAQVNLQDSAGAAYTPLHLACIKAHFRAAEALLELGADVHLKDTSGDTPLHLSIGGRVEDDYQSEVGRQENQLRVAIASMLISNGAYVDAENNKGRSPLQYGVPPVREGVKRFIQHNEGLVKRQRGGSKMSMLSTSSASGGQLKDALKGVGLPCGVCGRSKSDVTLSPCQHKCVCSACSAKVTVCPLCDEVVKDKAVTGTDEQTFDANACKQM